MNEQTSLQAELEKIEQAIAAQEAKRAALLAALSGSGAAAVGERAVAAGERGVAVRGSVAGHVVTGNGNVINADPAQAEAERAKARYLRRLRQRCNVLPLAAMGGDEGVGDEITLEQVYVALDTKTQVPLTEEEKKERQERLFERGDTRPLTAMEVATRTPRLALLGDPGSGKSTFARQLAAWLAAIHLGERDPLPGWEADLLPVLITLRELSPRLAALALDGLSGAEREARLVANVRRLLSDALVACKAQAWDARLEDALTDGRVFLIFDGLDEVAEDSRARVRRAVHTLLQAYPQIQRVILTCRVRSYTESVALPGFEAHTLAPFDEGKIKDFVAAWYRAQAALGRLTDDQAAGRAHDLAQATSRDELRDLASNPMLLTTMALIHQREVGLPRERVRLYALAVRVLLTRWQQRKGIAVSEPLAEMLTDDLKLRTILERLAYEAHRRQADRSQAADLPRSDLLLLLEDPAYLGDLGLAGEFLDYVDQRAGLLVGQGGGEVGERPQTYSFPHRTFQEYLAGCRLVGQRGTVREYWQRAAEGDFWYLAAQLGAEELFYNRRSEPELLDLAYALSPSGEPSDERAWRATVWSGQMAALLGQEAIRRDTGRPDGGAAYLERLIPRLAQVLRQAPLRAVERAEAGDALARLGDPRFRPDAWFLPDEPLLGFVEIPASEFLMGSDKQQDDMAYDDEQPQHPLMLPTYYIARYPVTVAQFRAFVEHSGYQPEDEDSLKGVDTHPVVNVTWHEALAYCRWLTDALRDGADTPEPLATRLRVGVDSGPPWVVTLPSEAQWEKAASWAEERGSKGVGGEKRRYPWGSNPDPERANYNDTGIGTTSAVGCFPGGASPYGVEDLSGNVWEWTCSHWKNYPYDPADGREDLGARDNVRRVLRGGAFDDTERRVRCAYRDRYLPFDRHGYYGFRVVAASPFRSEL
ncbi:MAG: hypothetical protein DRJ03_25120 [Chloroflexi bacterium]|nr:MAG: hypothetical protein DRJ03_25120 [Chloroflexota bacterium]